MVPNLIIFLPCTILEKINAVKLERHAIIQYSERHNKSLMAHDQMANNVNFNQSGKASSMKAASAMIEMVRCSQVLTHIFFLLLVLMISLILINRFV